MTKKRVLIVDDDKEFAAAIATRCRSLGLEVQTASNSLSAVTWMEQSPPDLLCLDVDMPTGNGLDLGAFLSGDSTANFPQVIVITGRNDMETRPRCGELRASYVHKSTNLWNNLRPLICDLLQLEPSQSTTPQAESVAQLPSAENDDRPTANQPNSVNDAIASPRVLIADDDPDIVNLLAQRCEQLGFEVDSANNAMTALGKIEASRPDIAILDVEMPSGNGLSVREMMLHHQQLQSIPVIMLTGSTNEQTVRRCHESAAYYVLKCPDVWSRVEPLLRELLGQPEESDAKELVPV